MPTLVGNPGHSTRQQIFTALFSYLQTNVPAPIDPNTNKPIPFKSYSQFLKQWDQVPPANQPAMYLKRGPQLFEQNKVFGLTKLLLRASVWVYFRTEAFRLDPNYPDQLTDSFIDGFESAFQSTPSITRITLGNLVYHVWIDGQVFSDPGLTDNQALVIVPLSILV